MKRILIALLMVWAGLAAAQNLPTHAYYNTGTGPLAPPYAFTYSTYAAFAASPVYALPAQYAGQNVLTGDQGAYYSNGTAWVAMVNGSAHSSTISAPFLFSGSSTVTVNGTSNALTGVSAPAQLTVVSSTTNSVTVQFQGSNDGATFYTIGTVQVNGQPVTIGSQTFNGGTYSIPLNVPYVALKAIVSGMSTGSITVNAVQGQTAVPAPNGARGNTFSSVNPQLTGSPVASGRYVISKSAIPLIVPAGIYNYGSGVIQTGIPMSNSAQLDVWNNPANTASVNFSGGTGLTTGSTGVNMAFTAAALYGNSQDVGRRVFVGGATLYVTITAAISTTQATVTVTSGTISASYSNGGILMDVLSGTGVLLHATASTFLGTSGDVGAIVGIDDGSGTYKYITVTATNSPSAVYGNISSTLSSYGRYANNKVVYSPISGQFPTTYANAWVQITGGSAGPLYPQGIYFAQFTSPCQAQMYAIQLQIGQTPYVPTMTQLTAGTLSGVAGTGYYAGIQSISSANFSVPILGGTLGPNGSIFYRAQYSFPANGDVKIPAFYVGGQPILNTIVNSSAVYAGFDRAIHNRGVPTSQVVLSNTQVSDTGYNDSGTQVNAPTYLTLDTTQNLLAYPGVYLGTVTDWMVIEAYDIEEEYAP